MKLRNVIKLRARGEVSWENWVMMWEYYPVYVYVMIYRCWSNFIASRNAIYWYKKVLLLKLVNKKKKKNNFKFSDINIFEERKE